METPFPAYRGDQPYVFVCYAHEDAALVYPEIQRLHSGGVNVYYDEGISPGHEWTQELADAIDGSTRFLYFVSPASVASRHCRNEVQYALTQEKALVSVHLEPTELPGGLKLSLGSAQAILKYELSPAEYQRKVLHTFGLSERSLEDVAALRPATDDRERTRRPMDFLRQRWWLAAAASLLMVLGVVVWLMNRHSPEAPVPDLSIAVMPMSVVGDDTSVATYAAALTEELRTAVTGYQELRTVSAIDVASPREVHEASYVLGGNLQRLDDRVLLRVRLTRTADGNAVWAETFDRPMADAIADPADMATTAGRFVRLQLVQDQQCETVRRTSRSNEAAVAYCAALAENNRLIQGGNIDLRRVLSSAQRALALDPGIVDAHYLVGQTTTALGFLGMMDWRDAARDAHAAIDRGLAIAPNDPRLLTALGQLYASLDLDYAAAETSYRKALASDPLHPNAHRTFYGLGDLGNMRGNLGEALENFRRALRVYDSSADIYLQYAAALYIAGEHREAIRMADAGLALVPSGFARWVLSAVKAGAHFALGETKEADAALDDGLASVGPEYRFWMVSAFAATGRTDKALQMLAELEAMQNPPAVAMVYAYASLNDARAFEWIHKAIDRRMVEIISTLRLSPTFSELRKDPRWNDVMRHLEAEETKGRASGRASE